MTQMTKSKPVVFMFPGQGAQYYQMARELYDEHPRFRLWMQHCDEIVHPLIGQSLIDIIYQGSKFEDFDRIKYSNPALIAVEFSLAKIIMEMGVQPDFFVGYSLGEFTAAIVSGAMSIEQGLALVVDYAEILEEKSPCAGMLAIIEQESVMSEYPEIFQDCWLASRNFQNSFVVSGLEKSIRRLQNALMDRGIPCQKLPVNYAFHSSIMDPLEEDLKRITRQHDFSRLKIPTISALKTQQIDSVNADHFWDLIRQPIDFAQTIQKMLEKDDYLFIDVGPSGTLATIVKYLLPKGTQSLSIELINQFGNDLQMIDKFKSIVLGRKLSEPLPA